ncbi:MAG TPA: hypothetical protein DEO89_04785 [Lachnospiraceae bacterium]|nr:hypothetical protein [Lachnospiraceae bacterium]
MKLKRFLSLCAVSIFAAALLAGCSSDNTQDTQTSADTTSSNSSQTDTSSDSQDTSSDDSEKKSTSVAIPWDEVSDGYEDAAAEAKNEVVNAASISKEDLKSWSSTIRKDYKVIKDGVTKANKETAKEMFVTGAKIEALSERSGDVSDEEFVHLGTTAKDYVKALHGGGSASLSDTYYDLDTSLTVTKKLGDDKWNALVKKLN